MMKLEMFEDSYGLKFINPENVAFIKGGYEVDEDGDTYYELAVYFKKLKFADFIKLAFYEEDVDLLKDCIYKLSNITSQLASKAAEKVFEDEE